MILRSFFRKRIIKIYYVILVLTMSAILIIRGLSLYNSSMIEKEYSNKSLIYVETNTEIKKELQKNKLVNSVRETLVFDYTNGWMDKSILAVYELDNKVLIYSDINTDYSLSNEEIIISLKEEDYVKCKTEKTTEFLEFTLLDKKYNFKVKDVIENNYKNEIYISSAMFEKLKVKNENKIYLISTSSEENEYEIIKQLNKKDIKSMILTSEESIDYKERSELEKFVNVLNFAALIFCCIFVLIVFIVNKNIISDLKTNILLEFRIGFNKVQLRKNIILRLVCLHLLVLITCLFMLVISSVMLCYISKEIIKLLFYLFIYCLISDLLLGLIAEHKSNL